MKWFEKHYEIDDYTVIMTGSFEESKITIGAWIDINGEYHLKKLYEKPVMMWTYQDVLAEDILSKYQGMIKKCEKHLPIIIEKIKIGKRI